MLVFLRLSLVLCALLLVAVGLVISLRLAHVDTPLPAANAYYPQDSLRVGDFLLGWGRPAGERDDGDVIDVWWLDETEIDAQRQGYSPFSRVKFLNFKDGPQPGNAWRGFMTRVR